MARQISAAAPGRCGFHLPRPLNHSISPAISIASSAGDLHGFWVESFYMNKNSPKLKVTVVTGIKLLKSKLCNVQGLTCVSPRQPCTPHACHHGPCSMLQKNHSQSLFLQRMKMVGIDLPGKYFHQLGKIVHYLWVVSHSMNRCFTLHPFPQGSYLESILDRTTQLYLQHASTKDISGQSAGVNIKFVIRQKNM